MKSKTPELEVIRDILASQFMELNKPFVDTKSEGEIIVKKVFMEIEKRGYNINDGIQELLTYLFNFINFVKKAQHIGHLNIRLPFIFSVQDIKDIYADYVKEQKLGVSAFASENIVDEKIERLKKEMSNILLEISKLTNSPKNMFRFILSHTKTSPVHEFVRNWIKQNFGEDMLSMIESNKRTYEPPIMDNSLFSRFMGKVKQYERLLKNTTRTS